MDDGGRRAHSHARHHGLSRREFLGATATAAGVAVSSSIWMPTAALSGDFEGSRWSDVIPMVPRPVPIPGGDTLGGVLYHQFVPGDPDLLLDGFDAEPNGITNFRGLAMMGYTTGTAVGSDGKTYNALTDNRVCQGEYIAADGRKAHGTFVET